MGVRKNISSTVKLLRSYIYIFLFFLSPNMTLANLTNLTYIDKFNHNYNLIYTFQWPKLFLNFVSRDASPSKFVRQEYMKQIYQLTLTVNTAKGFSNLRQGLGFRVNDYLKFAVIIFQKKLIAITFQTKITTFVEYESTSIDMDGGRSTSPQTIAFRLQIVKKTYLFLIISLQLPKFININQSGLRTQFSKVDLSRCI